MTNNYNRAIGEALRKLRENANMTQSEVGERIGKSKETVYGYERGRNNISASTLIELLQIYGKDANDFIKELKV